MKKKENKRKAMIIIGVILIIIVGIIIFFNISYSKTRNEFSNLVNNLIKKPDSVNEVFTEGDIKNLPAPVQKYFRSCGYIGAPKMSYMRIKFFDVAFLMGKNKPTLNIDYTQYNFVDMPSRIAYIKSSMYGIPFEGLDSYVNGSGSMKGVIAKTFILFNQKGKEMDKASLVTYLSESLIIPNVAIQDLITWEEIDDLRVKATISSYGITVSGIFTFNEKGEMHSFTTDDREYTSGNGKLEKVKWSIICDNYKETNGIKMPTVLQAIWHFDDGDLMYFNGNNFKIEYYR